MTKQSNFSDRPRRQGQRHNHALGAGIVRSVNNGHRRMGPDARTKRASSTKRAPRPVFRFPEDPVEQPFNPLITEEN